MDITIQNVRSPALEHNGRIIGYFSHGHEMNC